MRKFLLTILLITIVLTTSAQDKFVTTNGSGTACTSGSPCSMSYMISNVTAGETWYVRAGDYGSVSYTISRSGNSSNPIRIIGYDNTPNDIDPEAQQDFTLGTQTIKVMSEFSYGDNINSGRMPLLRRSGDTGTTLRINGDYIHLYNFQFSRGQQALLNSGDNNVFRNIIAFDHGNQSSATYSGNAVSNTGNNNDWKNVYVENAGAQSFTVRGNNNTFDGISCLADNNGNPTDYYFLFQVGNNNTATNIYVNRVVDLNHYGHGICWKTPDPCFNNNVDGFIIDNSNLEIQFPGVHNNKAENGFVQRRDFGQNVATITMANGSYDNLINKVYCRGGGIQFADWLDGLSGDAADSSDNNIFNQVTIELTNRPGTNGTHAIRMNVFQPPWVGSVDNNTFYNCTFYDAQWLYENSRPNTNTQFINCLFDTFPRFQQKLSNSGQTSPGYPINAIYNNSNFSNLGFATPSGTNITTHQPNFVDPTNFDLRPQNSNLIGQGIATPFMGAGNDIGSFQSTDVPVDPPTGGGGNNAPTAITFSSTGQRTINVDEGTVDYQFQLAVADPDVGDTHTFARNIDIDPTNPGPDPCFFTVSSTGLVTMTAINYEDFGDGSCPNSSGGTPANNVYAFNARVTDQDGDFHVEDMVVFINDVDEDGAGGDDETAPTIDSFTFDAITETSVRATWVPNEASQGRYRYGTVSGNYTVTGPLEDRYLPSHTQNITGLTAGTQYFIQFYTEDAATNSAWSPEQTFTTNGENTDPTPVPSISSLGLGNVKKIKY